MIEEIKINGIYEHFKEKKKYQVICLARDSENSKREIAVYRALYEGEYGKGTIWTRELSDFLGYKEKDGRKIKRFTLTE
ncbi:MAG: DUF1653 domain-containing protein [Nanoarchaeota archaeon]